MEGGARIPRNNQFERITAEPGKGEFVWVKHKQPKPAPSHKDSSAIEMTQQADTHHAESLQFSCPEDGCTKSYMTHGRLGQYLMYGKHKFRRAEAAPWLKERRSVKQNVLGLEGPTQE